MYIKISCYKKKGLARVASCKMCLLLHAVYMPHTCHIHLIALHGKKMKQKPSALQMCKHGLHSTVHVIYMLSFTRFEGKQRLNALETKPSATHCKTMTHQVRLCICLTVLIFDPSFLVFLATLCIIVSLRLYRGIQNWHEHKQTPHGCFTHCTPKTVFVMSCTAHAIPAAFTAHCTPKLFGYKLHCTCCTSSIYSCKAKFCLQTMSSFDKCK